MLYIKGSKRVLDGDGLYGLIEGNQNPSGVFEDSKNDENLESIAQRYGKKTILQQYRTKLDEVKDERRTDQNST